MRSLAIALLLCAAPAQAAFEDLGAGARAPGMGNAFTALADDVHAVHYNPAGLAQLERPQASAGYARLYMGLSDGSDLGISQFFYAQPLRSGRWGGIGGTWQRFALDDIYEESTLGLSWGRLLYERRSGSKLLGGFSFKRLSRGFKAPPEAANSMNGLTRTANPDPVLSGETETSAFDADLGLLMRFGGRFQTGLVVKHFMQPDVGFAAPDKLPMDIRLAAAYRALWMNMTGEVRQVKGPTGSADRDILVAAERWFPTLSAGTFGMRGGLGIGSRQWRQVSAGLTYRINKIQIDYAFLMPMGTVQDTAGTHRFAFTFHFGAPAPEDEITGALLRDAQRLREGQTPELGNAFADAMRPRTLDDESLARIRDLVAEGRYRLAHTALLELMKDLPRDAALGRLANRLALVAYYYTDQPQEPQRAMAALKRMIAAFLRARDREAVLFGTYALSLSPIDTKLDNFLRKVEEGVGIPADRLPQGHPRTFLNELLFRVEAAHNRGDNERVMTLLEDIRLLDPENIKMLERLGSTYFILGKNKEAVEAWEKALPGETDPAERRALGEYLEKARAAAGMAPVKLPGAPAAPAAAPAPAAPEGPAALPPAPAVPAKTEQPAKAPADPREVERLYQKGVEHYARGESLQATAAFMRVLQMDPDNAPARRALERLQRRK